jgi:hypothetical protein
MAIDTIGTNALATGAVNTSKIASSAVDDSTIEIASNQLQLKDGGITNAKVNTTAGIVTSKIDGLDSTIANSTTGLKDEIALLQINRIVDNNFNIAEMVSGRSDDFQDSTGLEAATDSLAREQNDNSLSGGSFVNEDSSATVQTYTGNGTYSTWTYGDATYGDYLTLASPGGNSFAEHNTTKSGGFPSDSFIEWEISGYGFCGFGTTTTNASAEASEAWYGGQSGNSVTSPKNSAGTDTYFYTYFNNGANATSGPIIIIPYNNGSIGPSFNLTTATSNAVVGNYYGGSYPIKFQMGVDSSNRCFIKIIGNGSSNQTTVSGPYYINTADNSLTDDPVSNTVVTETSNFQYVWGNYDGGAVESMRRIKFKRNVTQTGVLTRKTTAKTVSTTPTEARVLVIAELGSGTLNTDSLKYELSRDNGTTFTAATLVDRGAYAGHATKRIYVATVDLTSQPTGTQLMSRFTVDADDTTTAKVHGYVVQHK